MDSFTLMVRAIVLLTATPVHEAAHAYVADKLGDPTARYKGRLTLNPLAHFDLIGSMALLFTGIGWAKPVPVNPINFDNSKRDMALTALAGPVSNLVMAAISLIITKIILYTSGYGLIYGYGSVTGNLYMIFSIMCSINISLAIFNLIPVPPLDGSRIFNYFLSDKYYFKIMEYERYVIPGMFLLLWLGVFDGPLSFLSGLVYIALDKRTFFVDAFFHLVM